MPGEDTADRLCGALRGVNGLVSAYLPGSIPEGREHLGSDVDVGVLLDRSVFPSAQDRFDARLARHIMFSGHPIAMADATLELAHRRMVLSRAADLEPFLRRTRAIKLQAIAP